MTKTSTASPLTALTAEQALLLRDKAQTAQAKLLAQIDTDFRAQGIDPATTTELHHRNEEYLELADLEADLNELLADRY